MLILQIILIIIGFIFLIKGADWFVDGCSGIAKRLGIPQIVIGLTIVAMGTSAPEAAVSITAAMQGNADISIGNILGSNILNILIILGLASVIVPLTIQKSTLYIEIPFMILITTIFFFMGKTNANISRVEGILLWVLFLNLSWLFAADFQEEQRRFFCTHKTGCAIGSGNHYRCRARDMGK